MSVIRVATQNIWQFHGDWPARRPMLRDGLAGHDLVALQEAFGDQPHALVDGEIVKDADKGVALASRWPIAATHELASDTLVAEIDSPLGRLVCVGSSRSSTLSTRSCWETSTPRPSPRA